MRASWNGSLEIIEKLIQHGAKVNYKTDNGDSAFVSTCSYKQEKVI